MKNAPYNEYFILTNSDPYNYVLYKDFFYYAIISIYIFLIWYFVTVFKNYEAMKITDIGEGAWWLTVVAGIGFLMVFFALLTNRDTYPYSLAGLAFVILLSSMGIIIFNFDRNEIDKGFENDPTQLSYAFLLVYSFVSYFICS